MKTYHLIHGVIHALSQECIVFLLFTGRTELHDRTNPFRKKNTSPQYKNFLRVICRELPTGKDKAI
jgi:hypothetical protein